MRHRRLKGSAQEILMCKIISQQTGHIRQMLAGLLFVVNGGPALNKRWANVSCLLGCPNT